jgi:hypothetical protein
MRQCVSPHGRTLNGSTMTASTMAPLILTAALGDADFAWADALRRAHFPSDRNVVPAHLTLFHHLPPSVEGELLDRMKRACAGAAPAARIARVLNLGGGVAFGIDSPDLMALRDDLADAFAGLLTPQDRATPRLHITVQNKVPAAEAKRLAEELARGFRPRPLRIAGLSAWRYRDGPWEAVKTVRFREK